MKKWGTLLVLFGFVTFGLTMDLLAQRGRGRGAGRGYNAARMYNPQTVETLSGTIQRVETSVKGRGRSYGVHVVLDTGSESITVHLGPEWYMEQQGLNLSEGDVVEVSGSRISFEGAEVIVAAEVKRGESAWKLRESNGIPHWSRGPR